MVIKNTDVLQLKLSKIDDYGACLNYPSVADRKSSLYIDVGEFKGRGMTVSNTDGIQNLAEAEYAIALYMWVKINKHKFN